MYRKAFYGSLSVKKTPGHHPLSNQPEQQSNIQAEIRISLGRELTQFESDVGKGDIYIWTNSTTVCSVYLQLYGLKMKFGLYN